MQEYRRAERQARGGVAAPRKRGPKGRSRGGGGPLAPFTPADVAMLLTGLALQQLRVEGVVEPLVQQCEPQLEAASAGDVTRILVALGELMMEVGEPRWCLLVAPWCGSAHVGMLVVHRCPCRGLDKGGRAAASTPCDADVEGSSAGTPLACSPRCIVVVHCRAAFVARLARRPTCPPTGPSPPRRTLFPPSTSARAPPGSTLFLSSPWRLYFAAETDLMVALFDRLSKGSEELSPQQVAATLWACLRVGVWNKQAGTKLGTMAVRHYARYADQYRAVDTIGVLWGAAQLQRKLPGEQGQAPARRRCGHGRARRRLRASASPAQCSLCICCWQVHVWGRHSKGARAVRPAAALCPLNSLQTRRWLAHCMRCSRSWASKASAG